MNIPPEFLNQIVTGDARELSPRIPDESIDLIFTDPPYPREYLPLFGWIAKEGARILKPGGLLITLSGNTYFDSVFSQMTQHLDFYWIGGMKHSDGSVSRVFPKQMMNSWKPALWFSRGPVPEHHYVFDMYQGNGRDKTFHEWGQDAGWCQYYIEKLTEYSSVVFDPFTGGGTVPAVCKILERNYIAFEIDPLTAQRARERVSNTQVPLFVLQPTQLEMLDTTNEK